MASAAHPCEGARLGVVASSLAELSERLTSLLPRLTDPACRTIRDGRGIYYWAEPLLTNGSGGLAFLFPGEGSQYPGMLADLCLHFPEVRQLFDTADRIARDLGETVPPSEHLFGPVPDGDEKLWSTATAVNVVLNAQWALFQVLTRLGLRPDAVLGHSSGEILALSAAGVFQTDRALERKLGRLGAIMSDFASSGDLPDGATGHRGNSQRSPPRRSVATSTRAEWTSPSIIALTKLFWRCRSRTTRASWNAFVARTFFSRSSRFRVLITRRASARSSGQSPNSLSR